MNDDLDVFLTSKRKRQPKRYGVLGAKHLAAVGRAVDQWNSLEFMLDRAIWKALGIEQALGACVTAQFNSVHQRTKALIAALSLLKVDKLAIKKLETIGGKLGDFGARRNRLIHDQRFVRENGTVARFQVTGSNLLIFESVEETTAELERFCADVEKMKADILKILLPIFDTLSAFPQRRSGPFPRSVLSDLEPEAGNRTRTKRRQRTTNAA